MINHDNWKAYQLFELVATQWKTNQFGQRVALDYTALQATAKFIGWKTSITMLRKIKWLELGVLGATNGRALTELLNG